MRISTTSQRAPTGERKVVYKGVLDNPFKVSWPYVPLNVQNLVLASLVNILAGIAEYQSQRQTLLKKRKFARHQKRRKEKAAATKKRKANNGDGVEVQDIPKDTESNDVTTGDPDNNMDNMDMDLEPDIEFPPPPPVLAHIIFGINQVTKRLESQAKSRRVRESIALTDSGAVETVVEDPNHSPIAYVFVCRADVDPPILISHLPGLVASCNIPIPSRPMMPVHLIPVPKQAEASLSALMGLRRVSVLALDSTTPSLDAIVNLLGAVQPPSAPWLTTLATKPTPPLVPTHVKQLKTTAPRDIRASKHERIAGRKAAKEREKAQAKDGNNATGPTGSGETNNRGKKRTRIRVVASKDFLAT
ncbi:hypothetical protein BU17DRAFT_49966 [Hysterangium stoloniferum]|nr:hypothetical protein BU17DRAFT_49966 [Hysterangium stoloniferum]